MAHEFFSSAAAAGSSPYGELLPDVRNIVFQYFPLAVLQNLACTNRDHRNSVWAAQLSLDLDAEYGLATMSSDSRERRFSFQRLSRLHYLNIHTRVSYDPQSLTCLTSLRSLRATNIHDEAPIGALTTLTHLDLNNIPKSFCINNLTSLTTLDVRRVRVKTDMVVQLPYLKKLKTLLMPFVLDLDLFERLCQMDSLRTLATGSVLNRESMIPSDFEYFEKIHQYGNKILLLVQSGETYWSWLMCGFKKIPQASVELMKAMYEKYDKCPSLDINARSYTGATALHNCMFHQATTETKIRLLLDNGADANIPFTHWPARNSDRYIEMRPDGSLNTNPILPITASFFRSDFGPETFEMLWNATRDPYASALSPIFAAVVSVNERALKFVRAMQERNGDNQNVFPLHVKYSRFEGLYYTNAIFESIKLNRTSSLQTILAKCVLEKFQHLDAPYLAQILSQRDGTGSNALHLIMQSNCHLPGMTPIIRYLLSLDVDRWAVDQQGYYPLDLFLASTNVNRGLSYLKEFGLTPEIYWQCRRASLNEHDHARHSHNYISSILMSELDKDIEHLAKILAADVRASTDVSSKLAMIITYSHSPTFCFFALAHAYSSSKEIKDKTTEAVAKETWIRPEDLEEACEFYLDNPNPELSTGRIGFNPFKLMFCSYLGLKATKRSDFLVRVVQSYGRFFGLDCGELFSTCVQNGSPIDHPKLLQTVLEVPDLLYLALFLLDHGAYVPIDFTLHDVPIPPGLQGWSEYVMVLTKLLERGGDINAKNDSNQTLFDRLLIHGLEIDSPRPKSIIPLLLKYGAKGAAGDPQSLKMVKFAILNGAGIMELKHYISLVAPNLVDYCGIWAGLVSSRWSAIIPDFALQTLCDMLAERQIIPDVASLCTSVKFERPIALTKALQILDSCWRVKQSQEDEFRQFVILLFTSFPWPRHGQRAAPLWRAIVDLGSGLTSDSSSRQSALPVFGGDRVPKSSKKHQPLMKNSMFLRVLAAELLAMGDPLSMAPLFKYGYLEPLENFGIYETISDAVSALSENTIKQYLDEIAMGPLTDPSKETAVVGGSGADATFVLAAKIPFTSSFGATSSFGTPFGAPQPSLVNPFGSPEASPQKSAVSPLSSPLLFGSPASPVSSPSAEPLNFTGFASALPSIAPIDFGSPAAIFESQPQQPSLLESPFGNLSGSSISQNQGSLASSKFASSKPGAKRPTAYRKK